MKSLVSFFSRVSWACFHGRAGFQETVEADGPLEVWVQCYFCLFFFFFWPKQITRQLRFKQWRNRPNLLMGGVVESPCKSMIQRGHSLGHQCSQPFMEVKFIIPREYKTSSKLESWLKFIFALLPFPTSDPSLCPSTR